MVKLPSSVLSLYLLPPCSLSTSHLTSHHSTWYASLTICETTLSGSHLIATYVRRCGGRRRTLVGRWAGWVDRRACGFEAALSTTELRATTLLVYNNLPLVLMLWPGNWQIYVTGNLRRAIIWKNKKVMDSVSRLPRLTTELSTSTLSTTPLFLCWSFGQV